MYPAIIPPHDKSYRFPNVEQAFQEPNGLLAIGGDLAPERILSAYRQGIFPWFSHDQPILWWSPDPRMILLPERLRISRSLKKTIRKNLFSVTYDQAFAQVIYHCAQPRAKQAETWITNEMMQAYATLHKLGHAHSFETWQNNELVGGLYGIGIGKVFFGESMFSYATDASKVAFVHAVNTLQQWGYELIDCQVASEHLESLGAFNISRQEFIRYLQHLTGQTTDTNAWLAKTETD